MRRFIISLTMIALIGAAAAAASPADGGQKSGPSSTYPATTALQQDLLKTKSDLNSLSGRTNRALKVTTDARGKVKLVSSAIRRVGQVDDLLVRVIRQLKPVSKLPPTRSLGILVTNLEKLQAQVHTVRKKGDAVQKQVLAPMSAKLKTMASKLNATMATINQSVRDTDQANQHVDQLRGFIESRGHQRSEVAALESMAKGARGTLQPVKNTINELETASGDVEKDLNDLVKHVTPLSNTDASLAKFQTSLNPVNSAARELDKVLNNRVEVKLFGKSIGFTVRQVIEGPGNVADVVLKPLQQLADKALQPVMQKLKFDIKPPRELTELANRLDDIKDNFSQSFAAMESAMTKNALASYQSTLKGLIAKSTTQLVSGK